MATYKNATPSVSIMVEGTTFIRGVAYDYTSDQLILNQYVPEVLDRYIKGVL